MSDQETWNDIGAMFDAMAPQGDTITLYANPDMIVKMKRAIRVGNWRRRRRASEYC